MDINELTIGQLRELAPMVSRFAGEIPASRYSMIGLKCIVRTYSAGVWFGTITQKDKNEVIVSDARRLWQWHAADGVSLSAVATRGIDQAKSSLAPTVSLVWLEAIEIIPASSTSIASIEGCPDAKAR